MSPCISIGEPNNYQGLKEKKKEKEEEENSTKTEDERARRTTMVCVVDEINH